MCSQFFLADQFRFRFKFFVFLSKLLISSQFRAFFVYRSNHWIISSLFVAIWKKCIFLSIIFKVDLVEDLIYLNLLIFFIKFRFYPIRFSRKTLPNCFSFLLYHLKDWVRSMCLLWSEIKSYPGFPRVGKCFCYNLHFGSMMCGILEIFLGIVSFILSLIFYLVYIEAFKIIPKNVWLVLAIINCKF